MCEMRMTRVSVEQAMKAQGISGRSPLPLPLALALGTGVD